MSKKAIDIGLALFLAGAAADVVVAPLAGRGVLGYCIWIAGGLVMFVGGVLMGSYDPATGSETNPSSKPA